VRDVDAVLTRSSVADAKGDADARAGAPMAVGAVADWLLGGLFVEGVAES
jgi:hypothetical protein